MNVTKIRCINCAKLKYTGVAEIYRCEDDRADIHPILRTMTDGEAFDRCCCNRWKYRVPTNEMLEKYKKLKEEYLI